MKTFVLFWSTGDLASRYVLSALGKLLHEWTYDHLICVWRRDWSRDDFYTFLSSFSLLLEQSDHVSYVRIEDLNGEYTSLKDELIARNALTGEITYHLCLSPEFFLPVSRGLAKLELNTDSSCIMIEKPFGHDLASALWLNFELQKYFTERQIYRVDHFLGKNFVTEMWEYRLNQWVNWYSKRVEKIEIVALEELTVEGRGEYYDSSGAIRDVLQNHLLQILAFATMTIPSVLDFENIRDNVFQAISSVSPMLLDPRNNIILWQYDGYRDVEWVAKNSRTETYIKTNMIMDDPRWMNTQICLETGKWFDRKNSFIRFIFRDGTEKIFSETSQNKNNAYELLIGNVLVRNASKFIRWDSVRAAWQIVDRLLHCTHDCPLLHTYKIGVHPDFFLWK